MNFIINHLFKKSMTQYFTLLPMILMIAMYSHANKVEPENKQSKKVTHLSQNELAAKVEKQSASTVIIDVRTPLEFKRGHLPSAINIPHQEILNNKELLASYKSKDMVFYCHSGVRVKKVTDYLIEKEYSNIFHLQGDYRAWQGNNLPLEK